jgi:sarcosine oxidase subunit delta
MSFLLTCPNCGAREVNEFRYGGQILQAAKQGSQPASNLPEVQHERWYHRLGCRRWLVADRDVRTNEVQATAPLEREAP